MIQEAYVSYKVAKLLKEKGFDEDCSYEWGVPDIDGGYVLQKWLIHNGQIKNSDLIDEAYAAPTHQMAMAWLREEKDIDIFPWLYHKDFEGRLTYSVSIYDHGCEIMIPRFYDEKCENVVESALEYALENLI